MKSHWFFLLPVYLLASSCEQDLRILRHQVEHLQKQHFSSKIERLEQELAQLKGQSEELVHRMRLIENARPVKTPESASLREEQKLYTKAVSAMKQQEMQTAIKEFRQVIARFPKSSQAVSSYYWLGEIYVQKKQWKSAQNAFEQVIKIGPSHEKRVDAELKLAGVLLEQGETQKAKIHLERIVKIAPERAEASEARSVLKQLRRVQVA